jgi:hypothetical protein
MMKKAELCFSSPTLTPIGAREGADLKKFSAGHH